MKLPKALTAAELRAFLFVAEQDGTWRGWRARSLIELCLRGALRVSEACSLRPADINWADGLVEVRNGKGGSDGVVPLPESAMRVLRLWDVIRDPQTEYFLHTRTRHRLSRQECHRFISRTARQAGIPWPLGPHSLRHTCATMLLERGATILEVKAHLRHASISATEKYLHLRPDADGRTRAKLEESAD